MCKYYFFLFCCILFNLNAAQAFYPLPVAAKQGMVVSDQKYASAVGIDILKRGGNAIDAAVAVGYALAVVNPCCGNIGGGGFMLIRLANGKTVFLNFREKAPLAATPSMFLDENHNIIPKKSTLGYAAVAIPGTVLGFEKALHDYGTMRRETLMAGAIRLADQGFILSVGDTNLLHLVTHVLQREHNVAKIFLNNNAPLQPGDHLVQKDLANTLKLIAKQGPDAFYHGSIAKTLVRESQKNGGLLSLADFANYTVETLEPITCTYRGYTIITAPPPSSGGVTLCEMLNILEGYPISRFGFHSAISTHYIVEAMRLAYADRNKNLGDPNFVRNPVAQLISKTYAASLRHQIKPFKATPSFAVHENIPESMHTTHYSIVDKFGNAVAVTYTINNFFGAGVIAADTGFFLNSQMDDFTSKPGFPNQFGLVQGVSNSIQPGKRPLSSMTPTIVLKNNKPILILGSPGGSRIITTVLQTILNVLDYDFDIQTAVDAPRFHHQFLPDVIEVERPYVFSLDTQENLLKMGYSFRWQPPWSAVEAIYIDPESLILYGANDSRKPAGAAIGY